MTVHYESDFVPDYAKKDLKDFFIKDENLLEMIPAHLEDRDRVRVVMKEMMELSAPRSKEEEDQVREEVKKRVEGTFGKISWVETPKNTATSTTTNSKPKTKLVNKKVAKADIPAAQVSTSSACSEQEKDQSGDEYKFKGR